MALAKTNLSPEEQIRALITYNDQLAAGSSLESGASTLNDVASSIISQLNRIINSTVTGNDWFQGITTTTSGKTRGVNDLNTDLATLEEKKLLCRSQVLADVTVGAAENWVILGSGELPSQVVAIALTQNGTVGASSALSGAGFDVHELIEIAGPNATSPKNLVLVRDASTLQPIQSGGRDVYALMQFESGLADGDTITPTSPDRAKLSFVRVNAGGTDLEAVPVADIENAVINYSYVFRIDLENVDEDCFLANGTFTDLTASVDVTRQQAYSNQGATIVTTSANATLDLGTSNVWEIGDNASGALFTLTEGSGGGTTTLAVGADVDTYNNNAVDVNFNNGVTVDNGSNAINLGVTADQIDFTSNGTITATSASTVTVTADSANATLSTTTSGTVVVNSAGALDMDGASSVSIDSAGGVSIDGGASSNFTAAGTLTLSSTTAGNVAITSVDNILHSADNHLFDVTALDTGVLKAEVNKYHWENAGAGAMYPKLNADFTSTTATTAGFVVAYDATGTTDTIAAPGFTAGVAATSNPTIATTGAATFTAGDLITITGAGDESNNGLYEVLTHAANVLTIRGVGTTDVVEAFTDRQFRTSTSTAGAITGMNVTVLQADATGAWGSGTGSTTPITFTSFGSAGGNSLQQAYVQGNSISVTSGEGIITFSNATDATNVLEVSRTFAGAGIGIDLNMGASTTGVGLNVLAAGSGTALLVNNTGTGAAFTVQDGGTAVFDVTAAGAVNVAPTSGENATITTAGAGIVDINSAAAVDIDSATFAVDVTGGISLDSTGGVSNFTSGGAMTLSTTGTGDISVTSVDDILMTADDVVSDVTVYDRNGATVPGRVRTASTFTSLENANEGNVALNMNTGYSAATATNNFIVTVVASSTTVATSVTDFVNNGAAANPTATTVGSSTFTTGDLVMVTSGLREENRGIYEVVSHTGTALTLATTATTGAEFINNQVVSTTGDTAAIAQVTLSVMRVNTSGDWQIAENFSDVGTISYQDIGSAAGTLASVVTNQGGTAFTAGAFDTQWGLSDGQFLEFGNATNVGVLTVFGGGTNTSSIVGQGGATTAGVGQAISFTTGTATTATNAGGALSLTTGDGNTSGAGGAFTLLTGDGGATGNAGAVSITSGDGGATSGSGGAISITGGNGPTNGSGGGITLTGGNSTANEDAGGGVTLNAGDAADGNGGAVTLTGGTGSSTRVGGPILLQSGSVSAGNGASGSITLQTLAGVGTGAGGDIILDGGNGGVTGAGADITMTAGDGGNTSGAGGAVAITAGDGSNTSGAGGGITLNAGAGTSTLAGGSISVTAGQATGTGAAGTLTLTAGIGGTNVNGGTTAVNGGAGTGTGAGGAANVSAGAGGVTGQGGTARLIGGNGGATSGNAGSAAIQGGTTTSGAGGSVTVTATSGAGTNQAGGNVTVTSGAATGTGANGEIRFQTATSATVSQADEVVIFDNDGSGTGGGEDMALYTGTAAPSHSANTGSLFLYDDNTTGRLYVNESTGGLGSTWTQVTTSTSAVTRNFFQDTITSQVNPSNPLTTSSFTGGVLPVKPSAGFSFDTDAEVYLNGVLLMNGSGNEVSSGTGNQINVESTGPTFRVGDVVSIVYYTNSTSNTA